MKNIIKKLIKSPQLWTAIGGGALTLIGKIDKINEVLAKISPDFAEEFPAIVIAIVIALITGESINQVKNKLKKKK
jgi:carbamate kinase